MCISVRDKENMADINELQDVNQESSEDLEGATVGADNEPDTSGDTSQDADDQEGSEDQSDKSSDDDADIDLEAVLLGSAEPDKTGEADQGGKEKGGKGTSDGKASLDDRIRDLKEVALKLDGLPENQDANFTKLRRVNRELAKLKIEELEQLKQYEAFGDTDRIKEGLTLLDGLNGYDTANGVPSTHKFADTIVTSDPLMAYNLALNLLSHKSPQDSVFQGSVFAEIFTQKVLGLDLTRLADFQAISRGEVPEGYEGIVATSEDLAVIPQEQHTAFKRLTPKLREIVLEGMDSYASVVEKAEAQRILDDSQNAIDKAANESQTQQQQQTDLQNKMQEKAVELEQNATETIGTRIWQGLDRVAFSSDPAVDATMKQGIATQIFNLVHESPFIRQSAEKYFTDIGIDIKTDRQQIDYWFARLGENLDIETAASVRKQNKVAEQAHKSRREAEARLASYALKYASHVANKTRAPLAESGKKGVPQNELPNVDRSKNSSTSNGKTRSLGWEDAYNATAQGKILKAA